MATYEDIRKANASIRTTDIKGKMYAEVNERIKAFRMVHPNGYITTQIISLDGGVCVIKAEVGDEEKVLGTGTAYEKEGSTFINKTSYIENCETSAVGRALGMAGFGIDTSVASAEEVQNAIAQQNAGKSAKEPEAKKEAEDKKETEKVAKQRINGVYADSLRKRCENFNVDLNKFLALNNVERVEDLTMRQFMTAVENWDKVVDACKVE